MAKINGTNNNDLLFGTLNDDKLEGLEGNDFLNGRGGNDTIEGGDGIDILLGGKGDDSLEGNKGDDIMIGGSGDDILEWEDGDGSDLMIGGSGYDVIEVEGSVAAGDDFILQQKGAKAIFDRVNLGQFTLTVDSSEAFEVEGKGGNDKLTISNLDNTAVMQVDFKGGKGDDTLDASGSNTPVDAEGGIGDDFLIGSSADDTLKGGAGNDYIEGEKGDDIIIGGAGDDTIAWDDGDGSDFIHGGSGFDISQVKGADGAGDQFDLRQVDGQAIFNRLNLGLFTLTNEKIEQFEINGQGGDDSLIVGDLTGSEVQQVIFSGGNGDDLLDARESATTIKAVGGRGNDLLLGGSAEDIFFAGSGDDIVVGGKGNDIAKLGRGDDRFIWNNGDGSDFIHGGAGFDVTQVNGADGAGDEFDLRQIDGQAIFSRLNLGLFTLTNEKIEQFEINGQGGNDSLTVGDLTGSEVQSVVFSGGEGNDFLNASQTFTPVIADGGAGDDILIGGSGDDILVGGAGADLLIGGAGSDILIGGDGSDLFGFDSGSPFSPEDIGVNHIKNFDASDSIVLDKTVFSALTSATGGGLSANEFAVVNSEEEAALSDALIVYGASTGNLYYNANGAEQGFGNGAHFATISDLPLLDMSSFLIQD